MRSMIVSPGHPLLPLCAQIAAEARIKKKLIVLVIPISSLFFFQYHPPMLSCLYETPRPSPDQVTPAFKSARIRAFLELPGLRRNPCPLPELFHWLLDDGAN